MLNGRAVLEDGLVGFVSSGVDRFFNQLFATDVAALGEVEAALAGRPGFVWLCDDPAAAGARTGGGSRPVHVMHGMKTAIRVLGVDARTPASITAVSTFDDLANWHAVYHDVFGVDPRSLDEWRRVHLADRLLDDGVTIVEEWDEPQYVSVKCLAPDGYVVEAAWEPNDAGGPG